MFITCLKIFVSILTHFGWIPNFLKIYSGLQDMAFIYLFICFFILIFQVMELHTRWHFLLQCKHAQLFSSRTSLAIPLDSLLLLLSISDSSLNSTFSKTLPLLFLNSMFILLCSAFCIITIEFLACISLANIYNYRFIYLLIYLSCTVMVQ